MATGSDDSERLERLGDLGDTDAHPRRLRDATRRGDPAAIARALASLPVTQRAPARSILPRPILARLYQHLQATHQHARAAATLPDLTPSWLRHLIHPVAHTDDALWRLLAAQPVPISADTLTHIAYPHITLLIPPSPETTSALLALEARERCLQHLHHHIQDAIRSGLLTHDPHTDTLSPSALFATTLPPLASDTACWTCLDALRCPRCDGEGGLYATACFADDLRDTLDWTLDNRWWAECPMCHRTGGCPECRIHTVLTGVERALGVPLRDDERDALEGLGAPRLAQLLDSGCAPLLQRLGELTAPRIDINAATLTELSTLPAMTRERARALLAHRSAHGPFGSLQAIQQVEGFSRRVLSALRGYIVVLPTQA